MRVCTFKGFVTNNNTNIHTQTYITHAYIHSVHIHCLSTRSIHYIYGIWYVHQDCDLEGLPPISLILSTLNGYRQKAVQLLLTDCERFSATYFSV